MGRQSAAKRPAPRRRWPWTWVGDDRLVTTDGPPRGVVGRSWRGQEPRGRLGRAGLVLVVVSGAGPLVVPVDVVVRRPAPVGPGPPGRDQVTWRQVRRERTWAALRRRCRRRPPPLGIADRGVGDAGVLTPVSTCHQGTLVVEGKPSSVFPRPEGREVRGREWRSRTDGPWHDSAPLPGVGEARLPGTSPTSGRATVVRVAHPGRERSDLFCHVTAGAAPRVIRAWRRRRGMEQPVRTWKPRWATQACQVPGKNGDDGHLVLRLLAGVVLLDPARVIFNGQVTREDLLFSRTPHWRFLDSARLA